MKYVLVINLSLCPCISGGDSLSKNHNSNGDMIDVMTQQILLASCLCVHYSIGKWA